MATLWKKDGKLIVDENKSPIICDECPCEQRYGYIMSRGEFHRPRLTYLNNYVLGAATGTWYMETSWQGSIYDYWSYCTFVIDGEIEDFANQGDSRQGNPTCPAYNGLKNFHREGYGYGVPGCAIAWTKNTTNRTWMISMPYGIEPQGSIYLNSGSSYYLSYGCNNGSGIRENPNGNYQPLQQSCSYDNERRWQEYLVNYSNAGLCMSDKSWRGTDDYLVFVIDKNETTLPLYNEDNVMISANGTCKFEYHSEGTTFTSNAWGSGSTGARVEGTFTCKAVAKLIPPLGS